MLYAFYVYSLYLGLLLLNPICYFIEKVTNKKHTIISETFLSFLFFKDLSLIRVA